MNTRSWFKGLGLVALVLALVPAAFAQTTGAIVGTVTDKEGGQPLPSVQVTISSKNMQGTRSTFTDGTGNFRFREIPAGEYRVEAGLDGFGSVVQEGIRVGLDRTVEINLGMQAAITEVVTVTGGAPLVDVKSNTTGENFSQEVLTALPLGRNFTSALRVVASAQQDDRNAYSVGGASSAENSYIIDGVETTDVERGEQGKQINMEFVQEVEVKTGGYEAEYGRANGAVVNVVTKSGGNEFHGDLFTYYEDDSLQDDFDGDGYDPDTSTATDFQTGFTRQDYGFDIGGYLMKDKLWFFAAYDLVSTEEFESSSGTSSDSAKTELDRDLRSAKLTWNITENHNVVGSLFGDPADATGAYGVVTNDDPDTYMADRSLGGDDYTVKYLGILHPSLFLNAQVSRHQQEDIITPHSNEVAYLDRTGTNPKCTHGVVECRDGGFGGTFGEEYQRDQARMDFTYFLDAGGAHEMKLGYEYEKLEATKSVWYTGGEVIWAFPCGTRPCEAGGPFDAEGNPIYYAHEFYVAKGTTSGDPAAGYMPGGLSDTPQTKNNSVFLQDSWDIGSSFTLNIGFRWEKQTVAGGDGREWVQIDDNYAPRLGFVWDPSNTGRQKLTGFWGRFYQNIPMDINIRFMGAEADAFVYNQSLDSMTPGSVRAPRIRGALSTLELLEASYGINPVDPNLKGQAVDQFSLGYEMEVAQNWSIGITGIYNDLVRVIEDGGATIPDQDGDGVDEFIYVVGNPGEGTMKTAPNLSYTGAFSIPKPKREYKALQLTAQRRLSDNWGLYASYVYSKLEGNYDGTYQRSTGQIDPMINSAFDYYDFNVVWTAECVETGTCSQLDGPLSNDRTHQLKLDMYYNLPLGPGTLSAAFSPYFQSGRPITVQGWSDAYRNNELSLSNRGDYGEMDDEYEVNLAFGYSFPIGPVSLQAKVDVFNALNRQGETEVDQLWASSEDGNGSYHDGADASEAPNTGFLQPTDWQAPRNYRVSIKLTF